VDALIPVTNVTEEIGAELLMLLREAKARHTTPTDDSLANQPPEYQAQVVQDMLALAERRRTIGAVAQGFIVAYIARMELWRFHPNGYQDLREFLQNSGLSKTAVTDLNSLGSVIVPYCDEHNIDINMALSVENWPKLKEAISALRRAIKNDDPDLVQEILDDVETATHREAIRAKYQRHRERYASGITFPLASGKVVMLLLADDVEAAGKLVRKLHGIVSWDLNASLNQGRLIIDG